MRDKFIDTIVKALEEEGAEVGPLVDFLLVGQFQVKEKILGEGIIVRGNMDDYHTLLTVLAILESYPAIWRLLYEKLGLRLTNVEEVNN